MVKNYWDYFKSQPLGHQVRLLSSVLLMVGLSTSPALMSIACAGFLIAFGIDYPHLPNYLPKLKNPIFSALIFLYFLHILPLHTPYNTPQLLTELRIKLPFLLLPLGFLGYKPPKTDFHIIRFFFLATLTIVSLLTLWNYFLHFEEMNQRVLESKEIPIVTKVNHIYFSVMLGFGALLSFYTYQKENIRWFLYGSLFMAICLHLFSARTGLIGFYLAILSYIVLYLWKNSHKLTKNPKIYLLLFFILALPILAYWALPSFQNRILNTIEDLRRYQNHEDINHRSISKRIITWKMGYYAFTENPWLGVGMQNVIEKIHQEYEKHKVPLKKQNWLNDLHNQFLEYLVGLGVLGVSLFIFWLIYAIKIQKNELFLLFLILTIGSMLAESLLERQVGVCFVIFWYFFLISYANDNPNVLD